jgi:16S rRNA (cytosine1402-N4)-methyltransferase
MKYAHLPVMTREVVRYLGCVTGRTYVDCTFGGGGHTLEILRASTPDGKVIGMDRDGAAIVAAGAMLAPYADRVTLLNEDFRNIKQALVGLGVQVVDGVVMDLGVSSYQLDSGERGFSFRLEARLDMRMDRSGGVSAYELVNELDCDGLTDIFTRYGQERFARRIARAIVGARRERPVTTTTELAAIVLEAIPKKFHGKKTHPATKVFQALRIAVNDEIEGLKEGLAGAAASLGPGGRLVVISFHSLEDSLVKQKLRELCTGCVCPPRIPRCVCGKTPAARPLTRKAVVAGPDEVARNPRARSARLRAVEFLP